jgi:hypothetical protein
VLQGADGIERGLHSIDGAVSALPTDQARPFSERSALTTAVRDLERAETRRIRKDSQLPLDAPTPTTLCWMEIH